MFAWHDFESTERNLYFLCRAKGYVKNQSGLNGLGVAMHLGSVEDALILED